MVDVKKHIIRSNSTIKQGIESINCGTIQTVFIIDEYDKLSGVLSDSDVRRAILNNVDFNLPVNTIMRTDPIIASLNTSKKELLLNMRNRFIKCIPIVDENKKIIDIAIWNDLMSDLGRDNYVIIMAGGLGSRLRPLTDCTPKPLLTLRGKPILEILIENLREYGFSRILISVNFKSEKIEEYFKDGRNFGVNIEYLRENKNLGTVGVIKLAKDYLNKDFLLINGDILTKVNFENFLNYHEKQNFDLTTGVSRYDVEIPYGVVNVDSGKITSIEEKPSLEFFINTGIYSLKPNIIDFIPPGKSFDMPDLIEKLIENNKIVGSFPIKEYWLDIGLPEDYKRAQNVYDSHF